VSKGFCDVGICCSGNRMLVELMDLLDGLLGSRLLN